MWRWFHRVLLGTLLESFRELGVSVDTATLDLVFDDDCVFQFPALDNRLRFVGSATAALVAPVDEAGRLRLEAHLQDAWPDLVVEIRRFPVPDRLKVTNNQVSVEVDAGTLIVRFDLEAD